MIPHEALILVAKYEGLHKKGDDGLIYPYVCPANVWSIGYGATRGIDGLPISRKTRPMTVEECERLLERDLLDAVRKALVLSPVLLGDPRRLSAIISFIYNLGWPNYRASTLRKKVNEQRWVEASEQIKRWVFASGRKLPGLVARRAEEAALLT